MNLDPQAWPTTTTGVAVLALIAWGRERWRARQPAAIESANLAAVANARDQLLEDNAILRLQLGDALRQHSEDRSAWWGERQQLVQEIDRLEERLRSVQRSHATEIEDLLDELANLRSRHKLPSPRGSEDAT